MGVCPRAFRFVISRFRIAMAGRDTLVADSWHAHAARPLKARAAPVQHATAQETHHAHQAPAPTTRRCHGRTCRRQRRVLRASAGASWGQPRCAGTRGDHRRKAPDLAGHHTVGDLGTQRKPTCGVWRHGSGRRGDLGAQHVIHHGLRREPVVHPRHRQCVLHGGR